MKKITITIEDDGTVQGLNFPEYGGYPARQYYNDPCEFCQNNPKNNPYASGICSCALPALANPMF